MKKQFIAKLLALALVLSMVPATILAASAAGTNRGQTNGGQTNSGGHHYSDVVVTPTTPKTDEVSKDGVVEAKVINGTANVTLSDKTVEGLASQAKDGEIVLDIRAEGATKVNVSLSASALTSLAKKTGADLTLKTPVATITIPNEALTTELTTGTVRISVQATESNVSFSIEVGGKALKNIKGLKVTF